MFLECKNGLQTDCHDAEVIRYLREQRHDFINLIQVIWGYLQLNKSDKAKEYINEMLIEFELIGSIFKINNPSLSLLLYNNVLKARKSNITVDFDADLDFLNKLCDDNDDIGDLLYCIDKCFDEILNNACKNNYSSVYITICAEGDMLYIIMSSGVRNNCFDISKEMQSSDSSKSLDYKSALNIKVYCKSCDDVSSAIIEVKPKKA
ncbi:MAG TPA: hypothetical protein DD429_03215 [Clostridiaceae bacterium]|nr:hypothetical protein [Clostridiaceae bacterium]